MENGAAKETLLARIAALEKENALLKAGTIKRSGDAVKVPAEIKPLFDVAQKTVADYFSNLKIDPAQGTIEINDQRYVLVRASALSKDFLVTVQNLYADRGEAEAISIGKNFLFDIAHVIGINDAKNFHQRMNLTEPLAKLSAGPVHFAYSGWAFVDILPESNPTPDENFYLLYNHPYSFEADSWKRSGKKSDTPICIMNAGYSSGWCEASFGIPLTAVEVSCIAKGDAHCTFIMSPPEKLQAYINDFFSSNDNSINKQPVYEIPTFFDRKRVEEEMQRSKKLAEESAKSKADFIANVSHELRTPLGAIIGFSDLLQKSNLDAVQQDYTGAINTAANNLLSIINDILDLSKLDAGKFAIEQIPFSITELLHSIQVMFSVKAKQKNLKFKCIVDSAVNYLLLGDPMRLTQILTNLISNAIKFTEAGSVFVSCMAEANDDEEIVQLLFTIKDTGIGIPENKTALIFERFTQADTNTTRKYGGTGLGLPITKQLIELQGGDISFRNNKSGGVEFSFTLPYKKLPREYLINNAVDDLNEPVALQGRKILLVEDNLMNQKLATIILQNNGLNVTLAENGLKAIELLNNNSFDVILMDIQMPVMDGYKAAGIIRKELNITTPVIAMTAHALAGEKEKCIQAGMNDYISKPFDHKTLLQKIAGFMAANDGMDATKNHDVVNLDFLQQQTANNKEVMAEIISIFKTENPGDINQLEGAIARQDFAAISKAVHSLRNNIGLLGLDKLLNDALINMEELSSGSAHIQQIRTHFLLVKKVCAKAVSELNRTNINSFNK